MTTPASGPPVFECGSRVYAHWTSGVYYPGVVSNVLSVPGRVAIVRYSILFNDGDFRTVSCAELTLDVPPNTVSIGTRVLARAGPGNRLHRGTLRGIIGEGPLAVAIVHTDYGGDVLESSVGSIRVLPGVNPECGNRPPVIGERVIALWSRGTFYCGLVVSVDGGKYVIAFDDGYVKDVFPCEAALDYIPTMSELHPGKRVVAQWMGMHSIVYYRGWVNAVGPNGCSISFDDGDSRGSYTTAMIRVSPSCDDAPIPSLAPDLECSLCPGTVLASGTRVLAPSGHHARYSHGEVLSWKPTEGMRPGGIYEILLTARRTVEVLPSQVCTDEPPCPGDVSVGVRVLVPGSDGFVRGCVDVLSSGGATVRLDSGMWARNIDIGSIRMLPGLSGSGVQLVSGMRVYAWWCHCSYYPALLGVQRSNGAFDVQFDDGDSRDVPAEDVWVDVISSCDEVCVGMDVLARRSTATGSRTRADGGVFHKGVVVAVRNNACTVQMERCRDLRTVLLRYIRTQRGRNSSILQGIPIVDR